MVEFSFRHWRTNRPWAAVVLFVAVPALANEVPEDQTGIGQMLFPPDTSLLEAGTDSQFASDILLIDNTMKFHQSREAVDLGLNFSVGLMQLDYQADNDGPMATDPLGVDREIHDERLSGQVDFRWEFRPKLTWLASGGLYEGFTDYRSLWLSEYYRQGPFSSAPGYHEPDPKGHNLATGLRWEYLPASGFAQLDFAYLKDEVAPGYEFVFIPPQAVLRRGREELTTYAGRLSLENILHPRVRTLLALQVAQTTDRDPRFTVQGSLNWAPWKHLVWRNQAGYVIERPEFKSWSVSSTLEYDWVDEWYLSLFARVYRDTGYIENSLLISDATPGLDSLMIGAGVRWQGERISAKLVGGPYFTRYGETDVGTAPFRNLYQDRDWAFIQAVISVAF